MAYFNFAYKFINCAINCLHMFAFQFLVRYLLTQRDTNDRFVKLKLLLEIDFRTFTMLSLSFYLALELKYITTDFVLQNN
jgi:hypothetical protein